MSESRPHNGSDRPASRKPYAAPKLRSYGNIREITRTVGDSGANDGNPITGLMRKQTAL